ncbi:MAG: SRPBCC domain-containing protein [Phycisphaerales bacterium]
MTDTKKGTRSLTSSISLDATPEQVWEMLTTGEGLSRWFPVEARVTPGVGGELWFSWGKNVMEGSAKIVSWEPPHRLVTEWGQMQDRFTIEGKGGTTTLTIVTSGFGEGSEWDGMLDSTTTGWKFELGGLKHAIEKHPGEDRHVVRRISRCGPDKEAIYAAMLDHALAPDTDMRTIKVGDAFELELDGIGRVPVRVAVSSAPKDMGLVAPSLNDAYLRVLIEPPCAGSEEPAIDVTLWASTYGLDAAQRDTLGASMARTLRRLLGDRATPVEV